MLWDRDYCVLCMLRHSVVIRSLWPMVCDLLQALLSMGFSSLTRVGCHFPCQGSSWPRDRTSAFLISHFGRQILYHEVIWEPLGIIAMANLYLRAKSWKIEQFVKSQSWSTAEPGLKIHTSLLRVNFWLFNILMMALQGWYCHHLHFWRSKQGLESISDFPQDDNSWKAKIWIQMWIWVKIGSQKNFCVLLF